MKYTAFALLTLIISSGYAQKLPKVQNTSVFAPADIKIDGKADEWKDQFQAYSVSNFMYYTFSNDDKNLYLSVRMDRGMASRKIFRGGITLTINAVSAKNKPLEINFPVRKLIKRGEDGPNLAFVGNQVDNELYRNPVANKTEIDSTISSSNRDIKKYYKDIYVSGISEISENLISIYNPEGIRTVGLFNNQMQYTYELAVPLKYLNSYISGDKKFGYNIRLNAQALVALYPQVAGRSVGNPAKMLEMGAPQSDIYWNFDTEVSGEYTLAKKK